jgi:hypothetical protein
MAKTGAADHQKCIDEYDDLDKWEHVTGGLAAATAVVSGYLWYRYFRAKGAHRKVVEEKTGGIGLSFDPAGNRVILTYRF